MPTAQPAPLRVAIIEPLFTIWPPNDEPVTRTAVAEPKPELAEPFTVAIIVPLLVTVPLNDDTIRFKPTAQPSPTPRFIVAEIRPLFAIVPVIWLAKILTPVAVPAKSPATTAAVAVAMIEPLLLKLFSDDALTLMPMAQAQLVVEVARAEIRPLLVMVPVTAPEPTLIVTPVARAVIPLAVAVSVPLLMKLEIESL